MTNYERVMQMSVRELAVFVYHICDECRHCPCKSKCNHVYRQENCTGNVIRWLESGVDNRDS